VLDKENLDWQDKPRPITAGSFERQGRIVNQYVRKESGLMDKDYSTIKKEDQ
jgi:hypothetical protein